MQRRQRNTQPRSTAVQQFWIMTNRTNDLLLSAQPEAAHPQANPDRGGFVRFFSPHSLAPWGEKRRFAPAVAKLIR
jgi:hypothetical protein